MDWVHYDALILQEKESLISAIYFFFSCVTGVLGLSDEKKYMVLR